MQRLFSSQSRHHRRFSRFALVGGSACLLAGLSYATGLVQRVSDWFVTVEEVDSSTDRVIMESQVHDGLSLDIEVPTENTDDLVDRIENDDFVEVQALSDGYILTLPESSSAAHSQPQAAGASVPK